jgi:diketogulonate reductase-like aldo/keto reductase
MHTTKLNNGVEMPIIGMGTFPLNGLKLAWLVRRAVAIGYRSFDSAAAYQPVKKGFLTALVYSQASSGRTSR